jgi:hypothetical protein
VFGNGCQDMHRQPVGLREVYRMKFHARLHEVRDERHVASKSVEFGNDQGCSMQPAEFQRLGELGAITALAASTSVNSATSFQRPPLR